MQEIILYATANEVLARVRDRANAKAATPPTLARGCGFRLKIRLFANAYDDTPYPLSNLANITSWAFVMDSDWDSATPFKIVADAGEITVGEVQDQYEGEVVTYTEAVVPVSETNTEELAAWLGSDEGKDGLNAELIGYDGTGEEAFVLQIKGFSVRNRLGSVGDPTTIPSEYLNADQVRALIASGAALQFSPDGATWKDSQEEGDIYIRFRSASDASAAWSPAIALPMGADGADGVSSYIYVAYASDSMGSNFSLAPTSGLKYRAELHTTIPLESPNAADFSGVTWVKYIGDDGAGAGDMLKAVYDIDNDGVVDSAEKLATARKIGSADFDGTSDISLSAIGAQPALPTNGEDGQFLRKTATGVEWGTPPSTSWGQITGDIQNQEDLANALNGKISSPSGGTAGQVLTKTDTGTEWADAPSSSWGSISGTLANQTDLVAALALKQDSELVIESASGTTLSVLPGKAYSWTLSGNGTLSLGDGWTSGSLSDSVVLLSPGSYSVSCSGNITIVDSLQAGKMNLCVVRWLGDRARLYVVDSEQLGTITAQPVTASGTVGTALSVNLADYVTVSTGANASYAMASGSSLPSGLSLSSEGVLSGTPEAESADSLTVDVTAAGCTPTTLALTMGITAASTAKDLGTWEVEYSMGGIVNSNISGTYTATEETVTTSYGTFPVYSNGKYKLFPLETYSSQTLTSVQWAIETEVVADSMLSTLYCAANLVWSSQSPSADYVHVRFNNPGSSGTGPYVSVSTSGYSANTSSAPSYMYDGNYYLHSGSATGTDSVWKLDSPVAECYICQSGQNYAWSVLRDPATASTVVNELVNNSSAGVSYSSTDGIDVALANSVTYNGCTSQYHAS